MSQLLGDDKYAKVINSWQVSTPVTTNIPTLSTISWQYSVLPALLDSTILKSYFDASDPLSSVKPLNETVLSTATGSFIAVGVNRWASLYVINTSAYIETNDIPLYYYFNSAKQLQDIAGQYFYDYKDINDNIISMNESTFKGIAKQNIDANPQTMGIIMTRALGYSDIQVQETSFDNRKTVVANYLWQNNLKLQTYIKDNFVNWNTGFTVNSAVSADLVNFGSITS